MARGSQPGPNQSQFQSQNSMHPHQLRAPMTNANDPYKFVQLHQRGQESQQQEEQNTINSSQTSGMKILDKSHSQLQYPGSLQYPSRESQSTNMQIQSALAPEKANRTKQIPLGSLLPVILPELDKDRAMQLQTLYTSLRNEEMSQDEFVKRMRSIVGDDILKMAVVKMQSKMARESQPRPSQSQLQSQNSMQPHQLQAPVTSASDPSQFAQLHQRGQAVSASTGMANTQPLQGQIPPGFGSTQALGVGASTYERQHALGDSNRVPNESISHMPNTSTGWHTSSAEEQKFGASSTTSYVKQEPVDSANEQQKFGDTSSTSYAKQEPVISAHGKSSFGQQF